MRDPNSIVSALDAVLNSGTRSGSLLDALDRLAGVLAGSVEFRALASGQNEHVIAFNGDEKFCLNDGRAADACLLAEGRLGNLHNAILKESWVETSIPVKLLSGQRAQGTYHCLPLQPAGPGEYYATRRFLFSYPKDSFEAAGSIMIETAMPGPDTVQIWLGGTARIVRGAGKFQGARGVCVYAGSTCVSGWPQTPAGQLEFLRSGDLTIRVSTLVKLILGDDLEKGREP